MYIKAVWIVWLKYWILNFSSFIFWKTEVVLSVWMQTWMENEIFWYSVFGKLLCLEQQYICESTFWIVNFMKSKWSCILDKHLVSDLKCSVSINYSVDFKDTMKEECKYLNFKILIMSWNDNMLDILG